MPRSFPLLAAAVALIALAFIPPRGVATQTAHARGEELFNSKGCAHCHGVSGVNGDRGPDLQQIRNRMTVQQITKQIHDGSKGMPAFADQLTTAEVDDLVVYLRTRRRVIIKAPPPPPTPKPDPDSN